jgi:hypothetical protein
VEQQHVTRFELDALRAERAEHVVGRDRVVGRGVERPADVAPVAVDIAEHAAAGQPAARPVVDAVLFVGDAAVEAVHRVADVTEAVPLARRLRVPVVDQVVVTDLRVAAEPQHLVLESSAPEERRLRQLELEVEREHLAVAHAADAGEHALGREEVETAEHVVVAPHAPRGSRRQAGTHGQVVVARQLSHVHGPHDCTPS